MRSPQLPRDHLERSAPIRVHLSVRPFRDRQATRLRRAAVVLLACAAALCLWMVVLGRTLPAPAATRHWTLAWLGLDALEACALAATGVLVLKRDPHVNAAAGAAAALLSADAWFDITTAQTRTEFLIALALGVVVEVPLAAVCAYLALTIPPHPAPIEYALLAAGLVEEASDVSDVVLDA